MTSPQLERLKSGDFEISVGFLHTPAAIRRALLRSPEIRRIAAAVRYGEISEDMIRRFVSSIVDEYTKGQRLPHDLALATLAVVLELRPTGFAEEFLHDLARLELAEMSISINVARLCLKVRYSVPRHQTKEYEYPTKGIVAFRRSLAAVQRRRSVRRFPRLTASAARYPRCAEAP